MTDFERLGRPTRCELEIASQGGDVNAISLERIHRERATMDLPGLLDRAAEAKDTHMLIAIGFAATIACDADTMPLETIEAYQRVRDTALDLLLLV